MLQLTSKGHRVAIAGQVLNATTRKPIAGARVEITDAPNTFKHQVALKQLQYGDRWPVMQRRCDRTLTAPDGFFYFIDLSVDGDYTLVASVPVLNAYGPPPKVVHRSPDITFKVTFKVTDGNKPPFETITILLPTTSEPSNDNQDDTADQPVEDTPES